MPTTITVEDFPDQTGETVTDATAALLAIDPDVLVTPIPQASSAPIGEVISQTVESVPIEEAGGPVGSHGTQVKLYYSSGASVLSGGFPAVSQFGGMLQGAN